MVYPSITPAIHLSRVCWNSTKKNFVNSSFLVDPAVLVASINEAVKKFGPNIVLVRNKTGNLAVMIKGEDGELKYLGFISTAFGYFDDLV